MLLMEKMLHFWCSSLARRLPSGLKHLRAYFNANFATAFESLLGITIEQSFLVP